MQAFWAMHVEATNWSGMGVIALGGIAASAKRAVRPWESAGVTKRRVCAN
jgi:hypothetical protein